MTPTEVLNEIEKMTLSEKRALLERLRLEISEKDIQHIERGELSFVESLVEKGLLTDLPKHTPDDEIRSDFKRIKIKGEPLSETVIRERR